MLQESQQCLSDTIEAQPTNDQRAVVLGVDRNGYSYIHFPLFCGADLRVYRQKFEETADTEPESPPVKVCIPALSVQFVQQCVRRLIAKLSVLMRLAGPGSWRIGPMRFLAGWR